VTENPEIEHGMIFVDLRTINDQTLFEIRLLESIVSLMTIDCPYDLFDMTPFLALDFRRYLRQKRVSIPKHLENDASFMNFCRHYILKEPSGVRNDDDTWSEAWITTHALNNLRRYLFTYHVNYEDAIMIGLKLHQQL